MRLGGVRGRALRGTFLHAPVEGEIEVLADAVVAVGGDGLIERVLGAGDAGYDAVARDALPVPDQCYVLPGLVDLHVHAPQYPQLGQALDEPLESWLTRYTFPLEARYGDLEFARPRYETLVRDLLGNGTTTAMYFATVHLEATKLLADIALAEGQRALIGKVVMDDPAGCPKYYRDGSAETAVKETREFIDYVRAHPANGEERVLPVITPRFIPSCTDGALAGLGQLAADCCCHVQTHCSESDWAHGFALERYGETDTAALERFGLLTRRTVLAHANFITDGDMDRIGAAGAGIAHCAVSNMYFANAVFPLRKALDRALHVGLGTDISGGPIASVFEATRAAVQASRMLEDGVDPDLPPTRRGRPGARISMATAFYLATAGGGRALDLQIGVFAPGYQFDALLVDGAATTGSIRLFGEREPRVVLEKILYTAARPNLAEVWVGGQAVSGAAA